MGYRDRILQDGPVAYWPMDEAAGPLRDLVHGFAGALLNGAVPGVAAKVEKGAQFDGVDDQVEVPYDATLDLTTSALTLEAWVYLDPTGSGFRQIIEMALSTGSTDRKFALYVSSAGLLGFDVQTSGGHVDVARGAVSSGAWHHVVGVYDGANCFWYIDGAVNPSTSPLTGALVARVGQPLHFGRFKTVSPFKGILDEVAIYNKALTATQIRDHYFEGRYEKPFVATASRTAAAEATIDAVRSYRDEILSTPDLVAYWPMDEAAGASTLKDITGRGHNATVLAGVLTGEAALVAGKAVKGDGIYAGGGGVGQIRVPDHADFDFSGVQELTAECWIKVSSLANQQCLIEQYDSGAGQPGSFTLRLGTPEAGFPNNKLNAYIITDVSGGADGIGGTATLQAGVRYHAAITWKRSASRLRLYLNGVQDAERTDVTRNVGNAANPLRIGARGDDEQRHVNGWIDEVAIYRRELTAAEIAAHFNAGRYEERAVASIARNAASEAGIHRFEEQPYRDAILSTPNLLVYWPCDDVAGAVLADLTGTRDIALAGTYTLGATGKISKAASFNGTNGRGTVAIDLNPYTALSVEAWVYFAAFPPGPGGNWYVILEYGPNYNNGGGQFTLLWDNAADYKEGFTAGQKVAAGYNLRAATPSLGAWHHVVAVYDRSAPAASAVKIYVDGVEGPYTKSTVDGPLTAFGTFTLNLGSRNAASNFINGLVDEVAIYGRALTAAEIQEHFLAGLAGVVI